SFALVFMRMLRGASISLHATELLRGRKVTRAGWKFAACAVPLAFLAGHGSWTHWRQDRERLRLEQAGAESHALHLRGVAALEAHDLLAAVASFESAVRADPASFEARAGLANAYCLAERYPEGIAEYESLARLRPADADVRFLLGLAFAESGDVAAAERHWDDAIGIVPGHAAAREQLAVLCEARGDAEGARKHRAAAEKPSH
ncbi:MAG TPA: tetratricopeptide repeat protein, partial [Planctomycetota bacterium]|nr:tetratricopeptide repeat protein [Planctomycetota bacterium]